MKRNYHKWTMKEVNMLMNRPEGVEWKDWIKEMGLEGKVKIGAVLNRYHDELVARGLSKKTHKWTATGLVSLNQKPKGVKWPVWIKQNGYGDLNPDSVIRRVKFFRTQQRKVA